METVNSNSMVSDVFLEVHNTHSRKHRQWVDNQKLIHVAHKQNMRAEPITENNVLVGSRLHLLKDQKTGEFIIPPFFMEMCIGAEFHPFVQVSQVVHNTGRSIRNPLDVAVNVEDYLYSPGVDDFSRVICAADGSAFNWHRLEYEIVQFHINTTPFYSIWAQSNRGTQIAILRHEIALSSNGRRISVTGAIWYQDTLAAFHKEATRQGSDFNHFLQAVEVASGNLDGSASWCPYGDDEMD